MKDEEIISSINSWKMLVEKGESDAIVSYFENCGNSFSYGTQVYSKADQLLHLYPGIYNKKLYFFVIPQEYDNSDYEGSFHKYTEACEVYYNLESNRIPSFEAKERIERWKQRYKTWIPNQCKSEVGMFLAFTLEFSDFELDKGLVTLGLESFLEDKQDRADLIVTNIGEDVVVYDDYSVPVPPYGPAAASSFYLLSL